MLGGISKITARSFFLVPLIVCAFVLVAPVRSQEKKLQVEVEKVPARHTTEIEGSKLYRDFCAVCHGLDGMGNGPAAPALNTVPTDLTLLARNHGGKFPADHVMHVLSNESDYPAHGSADMPIWGQIFSKLGGVDRSRGLLRAHNLTDYLRLIQAK